MAEIRTEEIEETKIKNPRRMRQLIDFKGLRLDGGVYPTDIDGLIEYKDSEYILLEVKHDNARVPYGQKLALERMVDDFISVGKKAIAIVCEHRVDDVDIPVIAAKCRVREIYRGNPCGWEPAERRITVKELVNEFSSDANESTLEEGG